MKNIFNRLYTPMFILGFLLLGLNAVNSASTSKEPEYKNNDKCLVILGASYAGSWDINELIGCSVLNMGVGGNLTSEMNDRFEKDVIAHQPQYVLLWGFINDIHRSEPDQHDQTVSNIKGNYMEMVTKARQHGIEPVLVTEITIRRPAGFKNSVMSMIADLLGKTSYQEFINNYVMSTNEWLRGFASAENLKLIDFESVLASSDGSRKTQYAIDDGSHLTEAAYQVLTKEARKQLSATMQ